MHVNAQPWILNAGLISIKISDNRMPVIRKKSVSVERATKDLSRARTEINRLEVQLIDARNRAQKLEHYLEMLKFYGPVDGEPEPEKPPSDGRLNVTDQVIELLRGAGQPMHTRALVDQLAKKGTVIKGDNPTGNLSSTLSRSKALESSRLDGWSLVEWKQSPSARTASVAQQTTPAQPTPFNVPAARSAPTETASKLEDSPLEWEPVGGDLDDEIPF